MKMAELLHMLLFPFTLNSISGFGKFKNFSSINSTVWSGFFLKAKTKDALVSLFFFFKLASTNGIRSDVSIKV